MTPTPGTIYITRFFGWPSAVRIDGPAGARGWEATALPSGKPCRIQWARQLKCVAEPDWQAHVDRLRAEYRREKGYAPAPASGFDALRHTLEDHDDELAALKQRIEALEALGDLVAAQAQRIERLERGRS